MLIKINFTAFLGSNGATKTKKAWVQRSTQSRIVSSKESKPLKNWTRLDICSIARIVSRFCRIGQRAVNLFKVVSSAKGSSWGSRVIIWDYQIIRWRRLVRSVRRIRQQRSRWDNQCRQKMKKFRRWMIRISKRSKTRTWWSMSIHRSKKDIEKWGKDNCLSSRLYLPGHLKSSRMLEVVLGLAIAWAVREFQELWLVLI